MTDYNKLNETLRKTRDLIDTLLSECSDLVDKGELTDEEFKKMPTNFIILEKSKKKCRQIERTFHKLGESLRAENPKNFDRMMKEN